MTNIKKSIKAILIVLLAITVAFTFLQVNTDTAYGATKAKSTVKIAKVTNVKAAKDLTKAGKVKITWKKVKNATKYQVAYKKSTASKWTVKSTKNTSYSLKLKTGIKYSIKVRALNGKKTGSYSKVVKVKVIHHNATYKTVKHDAVTETVHHDAEYETVHHDAETHEEKVLVKEAWDEEVTGYKVEQRLFCDCGMEITDLSDEEDYEHAYNHAIKGEDSGYYTKGVEVPYTETIHHNAEYETKVVVDKEAYDEEVLVKEAYDEEVVVKEAYTEKVIKTKAYDEVKTY